MILYLIDIVHALLGEIYSDGEEGAGGVVLEAALAVTAVNARRPVPVQESVTGFIFRIIDLIYARLWLNQSYSTTKT